MGKAQKLKKLRRELRKTTSDDIQWQEKIVDVEKRGVNYQTRILRHNPMSRRAKYKELKKQGDHDDDE